MKKLDHNGMDQSNKDKSTNPHNRWRWLNRSIGAQFRLVSTLLAIVPVLVVTILLAWYSIDRAGQALQQVIFDELQALREDKAATLQSTFRERQNDMAVLLETVDALRQAAIDKFAAVNRTKTAALVRLFGDWDADVRDVASDPDIIKGTVDLAAAFKSLGAGRARTLYLGKEALDNAGDGSLYSTAHQKQHSFFANYAAIHGYEDALLIDTEGNVVYSLHKSNLYGTNLTSGTYKDSNLATLYKALKRDLPGQTYIADVARIDESYAMFIGTPIYSSTVHVGVLAYQLPLQAINAIVQERTGLSPTTESYLIAQVDNAYFYRSDRVVKEGRIGDPRPLTDYLGPALVETGHMVASGSTGSYELHAYNPLPIAGLKWAIITSGNVRETFVPQGVSESEDFFTRYTQKYGFYDMLLLQPDGHIFYTVRREKDLEPTS